MKTHLSLRSAGVVVAVASLGCARETHPSGVLPASARHLEIRRAADQTSVKGPAASFVGDVTVTQLFGATEWTRATGGSVSFQSGARSMWHTHPAGQTLIVTAGTGWVQEWGGKRQEIKAGDVVWTPPGVKHWHGASAAAGMTHLAIQEKVGDSAVTWMEPVSDGQYAGEDGAK